MPRISSKFGAPQASKIAYAQDAMVKANKLQLEQFLGRSRILARRLLWPMKETPSSHKATKI